MAYLTQLRGRGGGLNHRRHIYLNRDPESENWTTDGAGYHYFFCIKQQNTQLSRRQYVSKHCVEKNIHTGHTTCHNTRRSYERKPRYWNIYFAYYEQFFTTASAQYRLDHAAELLRSIFYFNIGLFLIYYLFQGIQTFKKWQSRFQYRNFPLRVRTSGLRFRLYKSDESVCVNVAGFSSILL